MRSASAAASTGGILPLRAALAAEKWTTIEIAYGDETLAFTPRTRTQRARSRAWRAHFAPGPRVGTGCYGRHGARRRSRRILVRLAGAPLRRRSHGDRRGRARSRLVRIAHRAPSADGTRVVRLRPRGSARGVRQRACI